ncbi:MAG TPA: DUF4835 family protein [Segetibacter sp.]|jgi:hypothetical protein
MIVRKLSILFLSSFFYLTSSTQELQAKVTVVANSVSSTVDKKVFQSLQTQLTNFLNNRKWTTDVFQVQEKIECNFLLNIERVIETNVYQASLVVQAGRPVFNSSYQTPLINYKDADVTFRYIEYQPLEFNENRIQGTDALASNLSANFSYYVYLILGLDYNSFGLKGGDALFQKAQNIVNNAPEARGISGWRPFDNPRNRYWLMENLLNSKYNIVHDVMYGYYRLGLDNMYDNEAAARTSMVEVLSQLQSLNQQNPNSMIVQFFMQGKSQELIKIFKKAPPQDRVRVVELLQKLDVTNAANYKQEIK